MKHDERDNLPTISTSAMIDILKSATEIRYSSVYFDNSTCWRRKVELNSLNTELMRRGESLEIVE